jgi:hypothetical protein
MVPATEKFQSKICMMDLVPFHKEKQQPFIRSLKLDGSLSVALLETGALNHLTRI